MSPVKSSAFCFLIFLYFSVSSGSDLFASQVGFDSLVNTEKLLLSNLEKYVDAAQEKLTEINGLIETISKEHPENIDNLEDFLSNPIRAFSLLKRLVVTWPDIKENLEKNTPRDNFVYINSLHQSFALTYPQQSDFKGASEALARIQDTYNLNIEELTDGIINGKKYSRGITWLDCYHIGFTLYHSNMYRQALVWMQETERKFLLSNEQNNSTLIGIYDNIASNAIKLGFVSEAVDAIEKILEIDPESKVAEYKKKLMVNNLGDGLTPHYREGFEYDLYKKVCRDQLKPSLSQQRNLQCHYKTGPEPYLKLVAFKEEVLSLNPYVSVFYDAVSDKEIELIKNKAYSKIEASTVVGHTGLADIRISKQAWLPFENFLGAISQRITDLTGLSMVESELFQVVNYGIGGHYEPHTDAFQSMDSAELLPERGNRVATALFYLSDVEIGGSTAFPYLKLNVKPEKGKLLYWENLHGTGDVNYLTKHAGCPVVLGNKWIGNAWLRSIDQVFRKPCGLRDDSKDSLKFKEVYYSEGLQL